jgi:hypothetical protein
MWHCVFAMLLVLACASGAGPKSVVATQSLEEAEFAYERGDYTQAASFFSPWWSKEWHRPSSIWA